MIKEQFHKYGIKIVLIAFFIVSVILPLLTLFSHLEKDSLESIIANNQFKSSLWNSILSASIATIGSVALAILLAWCITRSKMRLKGIFSIIFTLPMLIPSISHGMGLVLLFGQNGLLTNILNLQIPIYGLIGVVLGSMLYAFPIAFLMLFDILKYEDASAYEAAEVLGVPKWNQFKSITLPYLKKPLISVVFAIFTLVITDYGVPLMIGGNFITLPVLMYQEVIGLLNFDKGSIIGIFLLIPAVMAFLFDLYYSEKGNHSLSFKPIQIRENKRRDFLCYFVSILTCILIIFPLIAFVLLTFVKKYPVDMSFSLDNVLRAIDLNAGTYLIYSLFIAFVVSGIGVAISYITAYITSRMRGKVSKMLHLISITSLAIPGIVLGLSYVLFFQGSLLYGTFAILILVNLVHFFSSPYLLAYNSFGKINENLEAVGTTLGITSVRLIKDVLFPQMKITILEMFSYFFVNSMITISAVSFLSTVKTMPVSLLITQFEANMLLECSAFISLLILIMNLMVKAMIYIIKRKISEDL